MKFFHTILLVLISSSCLTVAVPAKKSTDISDSNEFFEAKDDLSLFESDQQDSFDDDDEQQQQQQRETFLKDDVSKLFEKAFKNCGSPDDLAEVQNVYFSPENPISGKNLTITTKTLFKATVAPGARIKVTAKLGFIPVNVNNYNLCDYVKCPLEPGVHTYSMQVSIPGGTPSVRLSYRSISETVDGQPLTCVDGAFQIVNQ